MPRPYWPALDIHLPADLDRRAGFVDLILASLDDYAPSALDDSAGVTLRAYFTDEGQRDRAALALSDRFSSEGVTATAIAVPDEGWAERSQSSLTPVAVGRILVTPPWHHLPPDASRVIITINPSMGFGTGHHQTTRLCLEALQQVDLTDLEVLDIGTGSGVLAIAAVRLGASRAAGLDSDPDAVESAKENVTLNAVGDRVQISGGDFREPGSPAQADLVVANLTGATLTAHSRELVARVRAPGTLIVSGFTGPETDAVLTAFVHAATIIRQSTEGDWAALTFEVAGPRDPKS